MCIDNWPQAAVLMTALVCAAVVALAWLGRKREPPQPPTEVKE